VDPTCVLDFGHRARPLPRGRDKVANCWLGADQPNAYVGRRLLLRDIFDVVPSCGVFRPANRSRALNLSIVSSVRASTSTGSIFTTRSDSHRYLLCCERDADCAVDLCTSLPINEQQAETTALLKSIGVSANDLLIVRAKNVDDPCEWAPLLSNARVLFCRNASALLTSNQNLTIQRFRQALYLYFIGEDSDHLQRMTADPSAVDEQMRLAFFGGILPFRKEERARGLSVIRTDLIPLLDAASRKDPAMGAFLRQYSRILVVDNLQDPVFNRQRLASYLVIQKEVASGDLIVLYCNPK
jgi:hypothetical protein